MTNWFKTQEIISTNLLNALWSQMEEFILRRYLKYNIQWNKENYYSRSCLKSKYFVFKVSIENKLMGPPTWLYHTPAPYIIFNTIIYIHLRKHPPHSEFWTNCNLWSPPYKWESYNLNISFLRFMFEILNYFWTVGHFQRPYRLHRRNFEQIVQRV